MDRSHRGIVDRGQQIGDGALRSRMNQVRIQITDRLQHESTFVSKGVRHGKTRLLNDFVAEK